MLVRASIHIIDCVVHHHPHRCAKPHPPTYPKIQTRGKKKKWKKKYTHPPPAAYLPSFLFLFPLCSPLLPASPVCNPFLSLAICAPCHTFSVDPCADFSLANFILSCRRRSFPLSRPPARAVSPPSATDSSTSHLLPYHLLYPYHFLLSSTLPPLFLPFLLTTFCHLLHYNLILPLSVTFYITTFFTTFYHLLPCHLLYHFPSSFTLPPPLQHSIVFYLSFFFPLPTSIFHFYRPSCCFFFFFCPPSHLLCHLLPKWFLLHHLIAISFLLPSSFTYLPSFHHISF